MAVLESYKGYYLWQYIPSEAAAGLFAAIFIIATFAHCWNIYQKGTKFCIPFALGCFCMFEFFFLALVWPQITDILPVELIGYIARATSHNKTGKMMPYIVQSFFILVAPALFAASIYMTLGRIIRSVNGEHLSFIKVTRLTKTFVIGDVLSFLIQGGSSGLMFSSSTARMGQKMVVGGLAVQIIMFGVFAVTAMLFQVSLSSFHDISGL